MRELGCLGSGDLGFGAAGAWGGDGVRLRLVWFVVAVTFCTNLVVCCGRLPGDDEGLLEGFFVSWFSLFVENGGVGWDLFLSLFFGSSASLQLRTLRRNRFIFLL